MSIDADALAAKAARLAADEPGSEPALMVATAGGMPVACSHIDRAYSLRAAINSVLGFFGADWDAEDVAIVNDPYTAGTDVAEFTLVHAGTRSVVAVKGRVPDIGGFELGGMASQSFDVWGEGARFPPIRLRGASGWRRQALDLVLLNSRTPAILRRRLAAMATSAAAAAELADATLRADGSGRRVPRPPQFSGLRAGTYSAERPIEGPDGWPRPVIRIRLRLTAEGVAADFSASDAQVAVPLNSTVPHTGDCCLDSLSAAVPGVDGIALLDAFELAAGSGRVTSARVPATTALARFFTGRAIRRAFTATLDAAGAVVDEDVWWTQRGRAAFEAVVDPSALHLRGDLQDDWRALERQVSGLR